MVWTSVQWLLVCTLWYVHFCRLISALLPTSFCSSALLSFTCLCMLVCFQMREERLIQEVEKEKQEREQAESELNEELQDTQEAVSRPNCPLGSVGIPLRI